MVQTRKEWLSISKLEEQKNKADAVDLHFKTTEHPARAFFKQEGFYHKRTVINQIERTDNTLKEDAKELAKPDIIY